jgi:hypothetical protein
MASYGSVPLDGAKQVAYEVTGKAPLLTGVVLPLKDGTGRPSPTSKKGGSDDENLVTDGDARAKELARWEKLAAEGASQAPPALVPCLRACAPWFSWVVVGLEACLPYYLRAVAWVIGVCAALPVEELSVLGGVILCFFGG